MAAGSVLEDLLGHLHSEVEHLRGQQQVLLRERQNVMHRDLEGVLASVKEKETLQMHWRILMESRRILRKRLSEAQGCPENKITLGGVIEQADEPMRSRLTALKRRLEDLAVHVEKLTEGNRFLIRSALGHISKSLGFLSQFQSSLGHTYDEEGRMMAGNLSPPRVQQQA